MSDQTFRIKNYYDRTIEIDAADGEIVKLPVRIRRFSIAQLQDYAIERTKAMEKPHLRLISRKPDGEEQEKREITFGTTTWPVPIVSDEEVHRRRLAEMTEEQRANYDRLYEESERTVAVFHEKTIRDHIKIPPHVTLVFELEDGTERQLRTGADLVEAFAGNWATLKALGDAVYEENTMSAEAKKKSRLLSDLTTSSPASIPTADGDAPAAIAASVATTGTAPSGAAMDPSVMTPSGSIAT